MSGFTPQTATESTPTQDTSSGSITVQMPPEKVHRGESSSGHGSSLHRDDPVPAMPMMVSERSERMLDEETVEMGSPDLFCIASEDASAKSSVKKVSSRTTSPSAQSVHSSVRVAPVHASAQVQSVHSSPPKAISVCSSPVVESVHSSPKVISVHASPVVHSVRSSPQIVHSSPKISMHGSPENTASAAASPKTVQRQSSRPGSAAGRSSKGDEVELKRARADLASALAESARARLELLEAEQEKSARGSVCSDRERSDRMSTASQGAGDDAVLADLLTGDASYYQSAEWNSVPTLPMQPVTRPRSLQPLGGMHSPEASASQEAMPTAKASTSHGVEPASLREDNIALLQEMLRSSLNAGSPVVSPTFHKVGGIEPAPGLRSPSVAESFHSGLEFADLLGFDSATEVKADVGPAHAEPSSASTRPLTKTGVSPGTVTPPSAVHAAPAVSPGAESVSRRKGRKIRREPMALL